MTSLQTPLTIITHGGGSVGVGQPSPPAATWFDEDPLHFVALEARPRTLADGSIVDGDASTLHGHGDRAASLLLRASVISTDSSLLAGGGVEGAEGGDSGVCQDGNGDTEAFEIVRYLAFGLPRNRGRPRAIWGGNGGDPSSGASSSGSDATSAFDAAKRAAQDNLRALTIEISVAFPLPAQLALVEETMPRTTTDSVVLGSDDEDDTYATEPTVAMSRRIPILAKFSPKISCSGSGGMRLLAMQFTPTMVRVAMVEGGGGDGDSSASSPRTKVAGRVGKRLSFSGTLPGTSSSAAVIAESDCGRCLNPNIHWTIDLNFGGIPVASKPDKIPNLEGSGRNLFGKSSRVEQGIVPGTTSIIGGGVLWCTRDQDERGRPGLDLVLVTTTSVLIYCLNSAKRQLMKSQFVPHQLASSFWYEPQTRTLVIGSYRQNCSSRQDSSTSTSKNQGSDQELRQALSCPKSGDEGVGESFPSAVMEMKTMFLSGAASSVEPFPTFAVGTLRELSPGESEEDDERHELMLSLETFDNAKLAALREQDPESAVVLPTEIYLVVLYGEPYCVELGSLGVGRGIGLTKLDKEAGCICVKQQAFDALKGQRGDESSVSVGVIDNLLVIFAKKNQMTHLLDVADLFSGDHRIHRESVDHFEPDMHDENLSFLAPSYFLDTSGQGLLYQIVLDLPLFCRCAPPTACIIPCLLRRNTSRATIRTHIMDRFSSLIANRDMSSLRSWMGVVVDRYSKSEVALKFDFETTVSLLLKSSLVLPVGVTNPDDESIAEIVMVPESCRHVLTQTEFVQVILLPHSMSAIKKGDPKKLKFISSLCVNYFVELSRRSITPCIALQCLVIALLWRTGGGELSAFLLAQQSQWTITRRRRQMNLPTKNRMYFDNPGAIAYAEALFQVASQEYLDKASVPCSPSTTRQLISYATIILVGCGATSLAVKCLLSAGHLNDAISICIKKIKPNRNSEDAKFTEGTKPKDFLRAATIHAKTLSTISERCKSFHHLYFFLSQWDPSAFTTESRKIRVSRRGDSVEHRRKTSFLGTEDFETVSVEQSILAHECPRFPDELLGGKDSACCQKLRAMFGYANYVLCQPTLAQRSS